MKERDFQKQIIDSFRLIFGERGYIDKIPDFFTPPQKGPNQPRFMPKRPFDLFGYVAGKGFAIELKHEKGKSWRIDKVSNHQFTKLIQVEETGTTSLVILKITHKELDKAYILSPSVLYRDRDKIRYSWDDLESNFQPLEKTIVKNKFVWDLRFLA